MMGEMYACKVQNRPPLSGTIAFLIAVFLALALILRLHG